MSKPLVSVVMPSYNSEKHIAESIQSIIDQTFTDWELIIVDGHSKDRTLDIIKSFMEIDNRIQFLFDEGKGIVAALNMGCWVARGKYIARMDSDDISVIDRLEKEVNILEKNSDVVLVSGMSEIINEDGVSIGFAFPYTSSKILKRYPSSIVHPSVMMRKDTLMDVGGYPPLKRSEDLFLWFKMMTKGKVKIIEAPIIKYRISNDSLSSTMTDYYRSNVNELWRFFANKPDLCKDDFDYLNIFITQNILSKPNPNRSKYARSLDNRLCSALKFILPTKIVYMLICCFRNIYGRVLYKV